MHRELFRQARAKFPNPLTPVNKSQCFKKRITFSIKPPQEWKINKTCVTKQVCVWKVLSFPFTSFPFTDCYDRFFLYILEWKRPYLLLFLFTDVHDCFVFFPAYYFRTATVTLWFSFKILRGNLALCRPKLTPSRMPYVWPLYSLCSLRILIFHAAVCLRRTYGNTAKFNIFTY